MSLVSRLVKCLLWCSPYKLHELKKKSDMIPVIVKLYDLIRLHHLQDIFGHNVMSFSGLL